MMMNLKGPKGRCRGAERGMKFGIVSVLTGRCSVSIAGVGRGTLVKRKEVNSRGILLIGPRACVGLDNRALVSVCGCCGISLSGVVMVCSSVSLSIKGLEVEGGKDTKARGNVESVMGYLKSKSFPEMEMKISGPVGKRSLTSFMLSEFEGRRRTSLRVNLRGTCGTMRTVVGRGMSVTVGGCGKW